MPVSLSLFIVFGFPCSEDTDWLIITNEKKNGIFHYCLLTFLRKRIVYDLN